MKAIDLKTFTAQLSVLINAGMPLSCALKMISSGQKPKAAKWILQIVNCLNQGKTFSLALKESTQKFDSFYCGMVEVGEKSGMLAPLLKKISANLESSDRLKAKIRKALAYPCAVLFISLSIIVSMLIWVIPTFESVFANFNSELPTPTLVVIFISTLLRKYIVIVLLVTIFISLVFIALWNYSIRFQKWVDKVILKIPVIGRLNKSGLISKWLLTVESLQQSGTPLLQAIRISARCSNQWSIHDTSAQMHQLLSYGYSIHKAASISNQHYQIFDSVTLELIRAGEQSGTLNEMLSYLSAHHEKQVDDLIGILMELLEPILVCFLGLVVGGMVIALYLPLFKIGQLA